MLRVCRRGLRARVGVTCLLWAALCLPACTSTTARLAGWYVTRELDGYLDLTGDQKGQLRTRVDRELEALRRDDLPRWLHLLRQVRDAIGRGPTEQELGALLQRYDTLLDEAVDRLAPAAAEVLAELNDAQIAHFEARMLEKHEKTYDDRKLPAAERREKADERLVESIESIVGDLRDDQQEAILAKVHALPDERPIRYRGDLERIHAFARFLRGRPGSKAIEAELQRLWHTRYDMLGPGRDKVSRRIEQRRLLLDIDRSLSKQQREQAVENINDQIRAGKRFLLPAQ
jgi:hypothetical protein